MFDIIINKCISSSNVVNNGVNAAFNSFFDKVTSFVAEEFRSFLDSYKIRNELKAITNNFIHSCTTSALEGLHFSTQDEEKITYQFSIIDEMVGSDVSSFGLNMILYGPPGGGKTEIMKKLYQKLLEMVKQKSKKVKRNIKLVPFILPGAILKKFSRKQAINYINSVFNEIEKYISKGHFAFIGIDECDSLIGDEKDESNNRSSVLTTILSRISLLDSKRQSGKVTGNYCFVGTTNVEKVIASPMYRRLTSIIFLGQPDMNTMFNILHKNLIIHSKRFKIDISDINPKKLQECVSYLIPLMGSDLVTGIINALSFCAVKKVKQMPFSVLVSALINESFKKMKIGDKLSDRDIKQNIEKIIEYQKQVIRDELKHKNSYGINNEILPQDFDYEEEILNSFNITKKANINQKIENSDHTTLQKEDKNAKNINSETEEDNCDIDTNVSSNIISEEEDNTKDTLPKKGDKKKKNIIKINSNKKKNIIKINSNKKKNRISKK